MPNGCYRSPIYNNKLAACTTAIGRERIYDAKSGVEEGWWKESKFALENKCRPPKVIYGDTDSVFIKWQRYKNDKLLVGKEALEFINYKAQKKILFRLNEIVGSINIKELKSISSSYLQVCKKLEESKYVLLKSTPDIISPLRHNIKPNRKLILSTEQNRVYKKLIKSLEKYPLKPALLSGISASGKTIVYIKIIESYLKNNKQIIVLVPEVSLIQKTFHELSAYFNNLVGMWHNKLSQSEKKFIISQAKKLGLL